ncbi:peptidase T [Butyrivibrio sp. NC2007]|uniref:peptidase T n=1 Tax=Butyrivibrio sp. NC2007 TaxID=1280683 RepID=UPI0003B4A99C|nr:peptidase T [Butyrivibrio sp. NC2007]
MNNNEVYEQVKERLIRYAKIDTQSAEYTGHWPTTEKQKDLARVLKDELISIGVSDVYMDEKGCVVYGRIPSNVQDSQVMPIGFIAHIDTAPDASGTNVKPWVLENYDGGDIVLNKEKNIVMKASDYSNLSMYIGQDLILTDGTTLLGGDDKASIAAIMSFAQYLVDHSDVKHGDICIAFTPDEEVGGLARDLDFERFGAKVAYTLDGDHLGWYEDETFNASEAVFEFTGRSVHTGTAKGIMVNAVDMAAELMAMLPKKEKPQYTEGVEGFYHLISCESDCEHARVRLLVRDFDHDNFKKREDFLKKCADKLGADYGDDRVKLTVIHQYSNMKEVLKDVPFMIDILKDAIKEAGIEPVCEPFRGGTDGAALSFRGLPCPNLSAGYENAHGRFEYVPIQSMVKNVEILLNICESALAIADNA